MNLRAAWSFVAGESRFAPAAVAIAIGATWLLLRSVPGSAATAGILFVAIIGGGLAAAVLERT